MENRRFTDDKVNDTPQVPLTLRPNRSGLGFFIVLSLVFAAISWYAAHVGASVGYLGIVFFGLGLVVFLIKLLPNSAYLRLTKEGFTVCSLFRCHTVPWSDTSEFGVVDLGVKKMVGWNSQTAAERQPALFKTSQAISGYGCALPETYGLAAEELCALLNSIRAAGLPTTK